MRDAICSFVFLVCNNSSEFCKKTLEYLADAFILNLRLTNMVQSSGNITLILLSLETCLIISLQTQHTSSTTTGLRL